MSSSKPEFIRVAWDRRADDAAAAVAPGFRHVAWDIELSRAYESVIWDSPEPLPGAAPTGHPDVEQAQADCAGKVLQFDADGMVPSPVVEVEPSGKLLTDKQLEVLRSEAFDRGCKSGETAARTRLERALAGERELLKSLTAALTALTQRPDALFEPLKRLALHLAQALARSELTISPQAIDHLVRTCLSRVDGPISRAVVTLNPDDLRLLLDQDPDLIDDLKFEADASLSRGSVYIRADDTVVRDLMEDRLQSLMDSLMSPCAEASDPAIADAGQESDAELAPTTEGGQAQLQ